MSTYEYIYIQTVVVDSGPTGLSVAIRRTCMIHMHTYTYTHIYIHTDRSRRQWAHTSSCGHKTYIYTHIRIRTCTYRP